MKYYIITARTVAGELHFTGLKFSLKGEPKRYDNREAARRAATYLIGRHPKLMKIPVAVRAVETVRKNPSGYRSAVDKYAAEIDKADGLLNDFSGRDSKEFVHAKKKPIKVGLVVGNLEGVMYSADRGDGMEKFFHRFKKSSRPLLIADNDGSQIDIVGGRYRFTERGIEDV